MLLGAAPGVYDLRQTCIATVLFYGKSVLRDVLIGVGFVLSLNLLT